MLTENQNAMSTAVEQGSVTIPEVTPEETVMLNGVVTNCVRLNVRKAPSSSAEIVCTIPRGTEVVILEDESTDEFYKVYTASGVDGFCMKQYVAVEA